MSEALTKVESVVVHAVVKLLCKRMESNPDEFIGHSKRWVRFIERARMHGTEADVAELDQGLYHVRMGHLHEEVLSELLRPQELNEETMAQVQAQAQMTAQQARANSLLNASAQRLNNAYYGNGALANTYDAYLNQQRNQLLGALNKDGGLL